MRGSIFLLLAILSSRGSNASSSGGPSRADSGSNSPALNKFLEDVLKARNEFKWIDRAGRSSIECDTQDGKNAANRERLSESSSVSESPRKFESNYRERTRDGREREPLKKKYTEKFSFQAPLRIYLDNEKEGKREADWADHYHEFSLNEGSQRTIDKRASPRINSETDKDVNGKSKRSEREKTRLESLRETIFELRKSLIEGDAESYPGVASPPEKVDYRSESRRVENKNSDADPDDSADGIRQKRISCETAASPARKYYKYKANSAIVSNGKSRYGRALNMIHASLRDGLLLGCVQGKPGSGELFLKKLVSERPHSEAMTVDEKTNEKAAASISSLMSPSLQKKITGITMARSSKGETRISPCETTNEAEGEPMTSGRSENKDLIIARAADNDNNDRPTKTMRHPGYRPMLSNTGDLEREENNRPDGFAFPKPDRMRAESKEPDCRTDRSGLSDNASVLCPDQDRLFKNETRMLHSYNPGNLSDNFSGSKKRIEIGDYRGRQILEAIAYYDYDENENSYTETENVADGEESVLLVEEDQKIANGNDVGSSKCDPVGLLKRNERKEQERKDEELRQRTMQKEPKQEFIVDLGQPRRENVTVAKSSRSEPSNTAITYDHTKSNNERVDDDIREPVIENQEGNPKEMELVHDDSAGKDSWLDYQEENNEQLTDSRRNFEISHNSRLNDNSAIGTNGPYYDIHSVDFKFFGSNLNESLPVIHHTGTKIDEESFVMFSPDDVFSSNPDDKQINCSIVKIIKSMLNDGTHENNLTRIRDDSPNELKSKILKSGAQLSSVNNDEFNLENENNKQFSLNSKDLYESYVDQNSNVDEFDDNSNSRFRRNLKSIDNLNRHRRNREFLDDFDSSEYLHDSFNVQNENEKKNKEVYLNSGENIRNEKGNDNEAIKTSFNREEHNMLDDTSQRKKLKALLQIDDTKDESQMDQAMLGILPDKIVEKIFQQVQQDKALKAMLGPGLYRSRKPGNAIATDKIYDQRLDEGKINRTKEMMLDVISLLDRLVVTEVQKKTCTSPTPDMSDFLRWMLKGNREKTDSDEPPSSDLINKSNVPEKPQDDKFMFHSAEMETEKEIDELFRKVRLLNNLIKEYLSLTQTEKTKVQTVHDYLVSQLTLLIKYIEEKEKKQGKGHPSYEMETNTGDIMRCQSDKEGRKNLENESPNVEFPLLSYDWNGDAFTNNHRQTLKVDSRKKRSNWNRKRKKIHKKNKKKYRKRKRMYTRNQFINEDTTERIKENNENIYKDKHKIRKRKILDDIEGKGKIDPLPIIGKNRHEDEVILLNKREAWKIRNEKQLEEVAFGEDMRNQTKEKKEYDELMRIDKMKNRRGGNNRNRRDVSENHERFLTCNKKNDSNIITDNVTEDKLKIMEQQINVYAENSNTSSKFISEDVNILDRRDIKNDVCSKDNKIKV